MPNRPPDPRGRALRKFLLSAAVLAGSGAYVVHARSGPSAADLAEAEDAAALAAPEVASASAFKDGTYKGSIEDAHYGDLQVTAVFKGGKLTKLRSMKYPNHTSASRQINQQAFTKLYKQAIASQSAEVDIVSGATYTCEAFVKSLRAAMASAAAAGNS